MNHLVGSRGEGCCSSRSEMSWARLGTPSPRGVRVLSLPRPRPSRTPYRVCPTPHMAKHPGTHNYINRRSRPQLPPVIMKPFEMFPARSEAVRFSFFFLPGCIKLFNVGAFSFYWSAFNLYSGASVLFGCICCYPGARARDRGGKGPVCHPPITTRSPKWINRG